MSLDSPWAKNWCFCSTQGDAITPAKCYWHQYKAVMTTIDVHASYSCSTQVSQHNYSSEHADKPLKFDLFGLTKKRLGWFCLVFGVAL